MKSIVSIAMVVGLLFGLSVAASAEAVSTPEQDKYGGVYKMALAVGPSTPIGYPAEGAPDANALGEPACERLVRNLRGGDIEYKLATDVKIAPDGKSITVALRKGVKFHDGTDFNAQAAKWNLDKQIAAKKTRDWTSVDIIDDYTIRINIPMYRNIVLNNLGTPITQMVSPTAVEKNGLDWARWHPVGTGPFKFKEFERDARLVYQRNENYWNKGQPYLAGLQYVVIADATVRKIAFQKGDIHYLAASSITAQELKKEGFPYYGEPGGTYILVPDSKNADSPFADKRVRLAVSHALDREALVDALGYGFAQPAYQLFPGYPETALADLDKHTYDPGKAKKLLAEAGYPNGFKAPIHTFVRMVPRDWVIAIANMLAQVGIQAEADFPEAGRYEEYRFKGWKKSLLAHGLAGFDNMNTSFSFYFGGIQFPSLQQPEGWKETYDRAMAPEKVDPAKTQDLIRLIHDDLFVIPYLEETAVFFVQKGVHIPDFKKYRYMTFAAEQTWLEPKLR